MESFAPAVLTQQKPFGDQPAAATLQQPLPHRFPEELPRSAAFRIRINNGITSFMEESTIHEIQQLDVLEHIAAHHTSFELSGPVDVEIEILTPRDASESPTAAPFVRPLSRGIRGTMHGDNILRITLAGPENLQIEIDGQPLLYIYALPTAPAAPTGPRVRRFEGGKIHNVGLLHLKEGETCWIDAGAVVRGSIRSERTAHVRVGGYGILDGSYWVETENRRRKSLVLDHCRHARIETILMLSPCHWMVVLGGCADIEIHGVRQIAFDISSDGIDICGSRRIHITGCCLHNGDDNIAIKAIHNRSGQDDRVPVGFPDEDWKGNVEDVLVENCTFYNIKGGSSMEIGYETSTDHIRNIRFRNIDVIAVHEFGSVFGIHNGDRACVENVEWDDIRVEHHYDKLIDIRVVKSRWNLDPGRGYVRNITLRNIRVVQSPFNSGYTLSVISGYDAQHPVSNVLIDHFELGGRVVHSADELDLVSRHLQGLKFSNGSIAA
ncbi:MAG: glycosyl hydrolase family 28 protein [Candidatus Methylacidiphilales bacterium]|nr:glycosyl hydrolase family 28 protein [Candidatus Methylacidiphilales bacterium]